MSALRIALFGCLRITYVGQPAEHRIPRTAQALLAFLLLQRHRTHSRDVLAGLFWGDHGQEQAHSCLNTALWRVRRVLEPAATSRGTYLVTTSQGEVGFNGDSDYWLDVAVFDEQIGRVPRPPVTAMTPLEAQAIEAALRLYTGELLEGFCDDWVLWERERLRSLYLDSLAHLMHYFRQQGAYQQSLACAQQILRQDPLREDIHRAMMHLYLESGQRALAMRQYELCRATLAAELGIRPMEETQAIYVRIATQGGQGPAATVTRDSMMNVQQALQQLNRARIAFEEAQEQLQRAIRVVEQFHDHQP